MIGGKEMKAISVALFAGTVGWAFLQPALAADAVTWKERVFHSFTGTSDGRNPYAGVVDANGTLYGTAFSGGAHGGGAVFSLSTRTAGLLHEFCQTASCVDGANPYGNMIEANLLLYGTTANGGNVTDCLHSSGCGTVFSFNTGNGAEKLLYTFCSSGPNCADGADPEGALVYVNGLLYGTTSDGGGNILCNNHGCGTVFSLDPNTGVETVLHSFLGGTDGAHPSGGMMSLNGKLYGTTREGGGAGCNGFGCGTLFSLDPNTGAETVLYSFCSQANCADGEIPNGNLVSVNGTLYGTTYSGGSTNCASSCGVVFSLDPGTGAEAVLYSFLGGGAGDGQWPNAGLIAVDGILYGTTTAGGNGAYGGTVFSLDPGTGAETVLYSFCDASYCPDGETPNATLTYIGSALCGTTSYGGAYCQDNSGCGTVFELSDMQ